MSELLFSYGTLQQREVQLANYGRELDGEADILAGYRIEDLAISNPDVVSISGKAVHRIARQSGNSADRVEGTLFQLSQEELTTTDDYEVEPYRRIEVTLGSGRRAWAYVGPPLSVSS